MNKTLEVIKNRYSCRNFTGQAPSHQELTAIAHAGVQSPSGINRQAWRVIVVTDKSLIDELEQEGLSQLKLLEDQSFYARIMARGGTLFYNAPTIVFLPIDPTEFTGAVLDCGIITQNVVLAASSLNLGNVVCGFAGLAFKNPEKAKYFKEKLGFPDGYEFGSAVLVGEAAAVSPPHVPDLDKISFVE